MQKVKLLRRRASGTDDWKYCLNFPSLKRLAGMKIASTYFTNSNMNCNMNSNINMH